MKTSKLLLAGLVISQAVAFPALAKKTMAEIQALCKGNKFESICIKAMIEQEGLADEPSAPVEPFNPPNLQQTKIQFSSALCTRSKIATWSKTASSTNRHSA